MPVLKIELNHAVEPSLARRAVDKARSAIHEIKGDPPSLISVSLLTDAMAAFGTSIDERSANMHLISFGLTAGITAALTRRLSTILWQELQVSPNRAYIIFQEVPSPHLTGWGGRTFAEMASLQAGGREDFPRRVRGRVVSGRPDPATGQLPPLGDLRLELWDPDPPSTENDLTRSPIVERYLGSSVTSPDGYFEIFFQRTTIPNAPPPVLTLRIYEPDQSVKSSGNPALRRFVAARQPVPLYIHFPPQSDEGSDDIAIGQIVLPFYEYDRSWPFPYVDDKTIRIGFGDLQSARYDAAETNSTSIGLRLLGQMNSSPAGLSVDDIQAAFPPNLTIEMERKNAGSSRKDDFFAHRLLNCFVPPLFRVDADDGSLFSLEYNWKKFQRRTDLTLLSFRARFRSDGAVLTPVDIAIGVNTEDDPAKFTTFTPADAAKWLFAKRLIRAHHHNVIAQFQGHLAFTHFNLEQYAIAFMRCIRQNPIRGLLFPFLREVMAINAKGRDTLVGGQDITGLIEPMQKTSLTAWITDSIGRQDWKGWKPRRPLCAAHNYAHCADVYWTILTSIVDDYFEKHLRGIEQRWGEILNFSNALVANSVPFVEQGLEEPTWSGNWYCMNEISERGRAGQKALHPVTLVVSHPENQDLDNLKQLCKYVIFHSTFFHSWTHAYMMTDLGELRYSGMVRNGGLGPESDDTLIAPPLHMMYALGSTATLSGMNCGYMVLNEEGDASALLIEKITAAKQQFAAWEFDISHLCSRLNT
jgi:lipoxygenase/macrophage migration inhibitory factor (MIF)